MLRKIFMCLLIISYLGSASIFPARAASLPGYLPVEMVPDYVYGPFAAFGSAFLVGKQWADNLGKNWQLTKSIYSSGYNLSKPYIDSGIDSAKSAGSNVISVSGDFLNYVKHGILNFASWLNTPSPSIVTQGNWTTNPDNQQIYTRLGLGAQNINIGFHLNSTDTFVTGKLVEYDFAGSFANSDYNDWVFFAYLDGQGARHNLSFNLVNTFDDSCMKSYFDTRTDIDLSIVMGLLNTYVTSGSSMYLYNGDGTDYFTGDEAKNLDNPDYIAPLIDQALGNSAVGHNTLALPDVYAYPVDDAGARTSDVPLGNDGTNLLSPDGSTYSGPVEYVPGEIVATPSGVTTGSGYAIQEPTVGDHAGALSNTGALADPVTGEIVKPAEGTGESTGTGTSTGTFDPGAPADVNWPKLQTVGALFTTRFPFSLPWDFAHLIGIINTSPEQPQINVDTHFGNLPVKFNIKLDQLDAYMPFFRGMLVVSFSIGLIMATRRLMGGGV